MRSAGSGIGSTAWALLVVAIALALFLDKAFHVDDPAYLWTARQIAAEPGDFYGFEVNWFGYRAPMPTAMMNPPLLGYYLAAATEALGSSEIAVHAALLVFPLAAALGTASIARRMRTDPAIALLATAATPAFLVSGSSAMCEMMMLAFWVWAVDQWILGVRESQAAALLRSGALIAAATLAKFYGIALVPLLAAYALARRSASAPPSFPLLAALAIPLAALLAYELVTNHLYGAPHFAAAMSYAASVRPLVVSSPLGSALVGLTFAGGCLATALCFAPLLWPWRAIAAGLALGAAAAALVGARPDLGGTPFLVPGGPGGWLLAQAAVLAAAGIGILALAALDLLRSRDADALLLALWVAGTFWLAAFATWSESSRANLPMAPALGLLVARRLASRGIRRRGSVAAATLASLALAIGVTHVDARLAGSAREAAVRIADRYGRGEGRLWFVGHWGFQYYLEERGGSAIDVERSTLLPGDVVAIPSNNTNVYSLPGKRVERLEEIEVAVPRWLTTMNPEVGAGFYSSAFGPLPWSLGPVPAERYEIFAVRRPIHFPLRPRQPPGGRLRTPRDAG